MFSIPVSQRLRRPFAAALAFILIFVIWNLWYLPASTIPSDLNPLKPAVAQQKPASYNNKGPHETKPQGSITHHHTPLPQNTVLPCAHLPGTEDILVILKTGATEIHRKLPIHFSTTFRCIMHYAIYSDMAEEINGHHIYDALDEVDEEIKRTNPDFELYRQIQEYRVKGKGVAELLKGEDTYKKAWKLDKWKFLPLMDKALRMRPRSKWYVFIEADTSLVWSNLLEWLAKFNPEEPLYIGGQSMMGSVEFAHGGTGFIVSNPALRMVTEKRASNLQEWDKLTAERHAGDSILAEAFKAANISLTPSWPILQGETPYTLDYTEHHWCFPVVSYHHMPSSWIKLMWDFEQSWISTRMDHSPMRHRDVFEKFVQPWLRDEHHSWDNLSQDFDETSSLVPLQDCRERCRAKEDCVQWFHRSARCQTGKVIRLGFSTAGSDLSDSVSGWMVDRIKVFKKRLEPCTQGWILQ